MPALTLPAFVDKWAKSALTERSASQSHFIDLCAVLGQPTPTESDVTGDSYTFEKGATKLDGSDGWADVWKRGHFAWEYKGKHKDLGAAYKQLQQYRDSLENPPLMIVCDLDRFEVHTNFTGTVHQVYAFNLEDLLHHEPTPRSALPPLDVLRHAFTNPHHLRPGRTAEQVTKQAASEFAKLAESLRQRGADPHQAAHFLVRVLFCLFAEDTGLLPRGLFSKLAEASRAHPERLAPRLRDLFAAMATGGYFGSEDIEHFNGGLFAPEPGGVFVPDLTATDIDVLVRASRLDWSSIEPAIFGTLFERSLDPNTRAKLGAQYTSRDDILLIVEPVLMVPLRRRWDEVRREAQALLEQRSALRRERLGDRGVERARNRIDAQVSKVLGDFIAELAAVRVLDPACGSGNFLYMSLKRLLDLEKEVYEFELANGVGAHSLRVGPEQLHGIEVNPYAHELAQVVVWIGYIQWLRDNGFGAPSKPVLKPLDNVEEKDAVLALDASGNPVEASWPDADVIVGNPPYLGDKKMRAELGDAYVEELRDVYQGRVPAGADLVTYWFEKARMAIAAGRVKRAGLLGTNSIRGGANRQVLDRIKQTGDLFMAWSDRPWVLDGAAVRVSMIGFDSGVDTERTLDGAAVTAIHADLTAASDLTAAKRLRENLGIAFIGDTKKGAFDITASEARAFLSAPLNPNGRSNREVVVPWVNGFDLTRRPRNMWIIDFGVGMPEGSAALFEQPFEHVRKHVKPVRDRVRNPLERTRWWLHARPAPAMRAALGPFPRFMATPRIAKHRLFAWLPQGTLPDNDVIAVARADDYFFGVLHSRPHELWALRKGTSLEDRPRYTPTSTFETYPFPWSPGCEPPEDPRVQAIANAARDLVEKRDAWLNPPAASVADLKLRTLTNLYNQRPTWLAQAHERLDTAVLDAYGWPATLSDDEILARLLALNLSRPPA